MIGCPPARGWISATTEAAYVVFCSTLVSAHPISDQRPHDLTHRSDDAPGDAGLLVRACALANVGRLLSAAADLTRALGQCGPARLPQAELHFEHAPRAANGW